MFLTLWILDLRNLKSIFVLPVSAVIISITALFIGRIISGFLNHNSKQRGAFLSCAMFSNIGITLGGFICFLVLGEAGFSYALIYVAHFFPFFFTVGFYMARHYNKNYDSSWVSNFKDYVTNPVRFIPTLAMMVGLVFNSTRIERPEILASVNSFLLYVSIIVYSFSIGLTLRFKKIFHYKKEIISISILKFIFNPAVAFLLILITGGSDVIGAIPAQVIVIESFMPVAIFSLVLSKLFDFDQDLANSCWISTTLFIIFILPIIYLIINHFSF